jgi:hypothetical protein
MSDISIRSIESRILNKIGKTPKKTQNSPFITQNLSKKKEPKTFYNFNSIVNINNFAQDKEINGTLDEKKRAFLLNSFRNNVATFLILRKYKASSQISSPNPLYAGSTPSKFSKFSKTKSKISNSSPQPPVSPIHLSFFFCILEQKPFSAKNYEENDSDSNSQNEKKIFKNIENSAEETEEPTAREEEVKLNGEQFQELFIQNYLDSGEGNTEMDGLIEKMSNKYEMLLREMTDKQVKIKIQETGVVSKIDFIAQNPFNAELPDPQISIDNPEISQKDPENVKDPLLIALFTKIGALYLNLKGKNRPLTPEAPPLILDSKLPLKKSNSSLISEIFAKEGKKEEKERGAEEEVKEKEEKNKIMEEEVGKRRKEEGKNIIDILLEAKDIFDVDLGFMKGEIGEYPELPEIQFKDENEKEVFKEIHKWLYEMEMELEEENRVILEYKNNRMEDYGMINPAVEEFDEEDSEEENN